MLYSHGHPGTRSRLSLALNQSLCMYTCEEVELAFAFQRQDQVEDQWQHQGLVGKFVSRHSRIE